jgi:hypothetical protein
MSTTSILRITAVVACGMIAAPLTASAQHGRGIDRMESLGAAIEKDGARLYHEIRNEVYDRQTRSQMLADAQAVYNGGRRIQELAHHGRINSVHREVAAIERSVQRLDRFAHDLSRHVTAYRHGDHLHAEHSEGVDARRMQRLVHDLSASTERLDEMLHHDHDHAAPPAPRPVYSRDSGNGVRIGGQGFSIQFGR